MDHIIAQYPIGALVSCEKMSGGLLHETYRVKTDKGTFVLQKISPVFGREVISDIDTISRHLKSRGMTAQGVIKTSDGGLWVEDQGAVWRVLEFIPGIVYTEVASLEVAHEAGKILGTFHRALDDLDYTFTHVRSDHHATPDLFARFLPLFKDGIHGETDSSRSSLVEAGEMAEILRARIPSLYLPHGLRKNVTHGDPKISNIIFEEKAGHISGVAMIDVDDCGRQYNILLELGDAFRSWCGREEDDTDNRFDLEKFRSALRGYADGSAYFINKEEAALLPRAIELITLELAMRFLTDYVEDRYFGWDAHIYPSRKAHNLARARGQIALYKDIEKKLNEIENIVHAIL